MVDNFDVSLSSSFIRKKRQQERECGFYIYNPGGAMFWGWSVSGCEIGAMGAVRGVGDAWTVWGGVDRRLRECMNSVRVCTGDKEITKSHKNGVLKERKRRVRNYRTEKVTKRPAGIRTGDLSLTERMLFRLSHKSRSVVNGVWIRLSQSMLSPSLTSHLLPYTLHARFGNFLAIKSTHTQTHTHTPLCGG